MWGIPIGWGPAARVVNGKSIYPRQNEGDKSIEYTAGEQQKGEQRRDCLPGGGGEEL